MEGVSALKKHKVAGNTEQSLMISAWQPSPELPIGAVPGWGLSFVNLRLKGGGVEESGLPTSDAQSRVAPAQRGCVMIHPRSPYKKWFDWMVVATIIYSVITVPYRMFASQAKSSVQPRELWDILDSVAGTVYIVFVFVNFNTGFFNLEGELVLNRRMKALRYLKAWFLLDIVSVLLLELPLDSIGLQGTFGQNMRVLRVLRVLVIVAVLLRLFRALTIIMRLRHNRGANQVNDLVRPVG